MADIKHWDAGICPSCGTLYAEIFTLCECELPHNTEGVEVERVRLVRDSEPKGPGSRWSPGPGRPPAVSPEMRREGARALQLWADESLREEIDAERMAELVWKAMADAAA